MRSTRSRPTAGARGLTNLPIWRTSPPTLHIDYTNFTERTIDSPERYLAEVELAAAQGYAEEHESFVNCIAVPIRDGTGTVAAATRYISSAWRNPPVSRARQWCV